MMRPQLLAVILLSLFVGTAPAQNENEDEPRHKEFVSLFKKKYFQVGALVQVFADFQTERTKGRNGFSIANLRWKVDGEFDDGYGYAFEMSFTRSPAILDARLHYAFDPAFTVDLGLFKPPFSKEFLLSTSVLDFINLTQVTNLLAAPRQIGVQGRGWLSGRVLHYAVGVFNGNGYAAGNDNNNFMYVARLTVFPDFGGTTDSPRALEVGVNALTSKDDSMSLMRGGVARFVGTRTMYGMDARFTYEKLLLSAEVLSTRLAFAGGPTNISSGYHLTGGYRVTSKSQVLVRVDSFSATWLQPKSTLFILGYNVWPTSVSKIQANYIHPLDGRPNERGQLLMNFQVSF
jgi:hypothetical protein